MSLELGCAYSYRMVNFGTKNEHYGMQNKNDLDKKYVHMIDNDVLIVTETLHKRDVQEILEKFHPLGMFDSIAILAVSQNMHELYRPVHVHTPLAPYFSECITSEHLDDMHIEIMINTLYKAYLEDVYQFYQGASWDPNGRMILIAFSESLTLGSVHFATKPPSLDGPKFKPPQ
ncbi:V-type proton ATPase subunit d1 [Lactuca sativa]|uniref:V-type proton ATPase subunit d1 n=1 Tax=Lactuca sativa TaxID=4236 RepID=UPI000CD8004E|nr:V-type proton ATPase subunit d1 [Lactuca sativa]